jgi:hypothetical protein
MRALLASAGATLKGLFAAAQSREVRHAYLLALGGLLATTLLLHAGLGWLLWDVTEPGPAASTWRLAGLLALRVLGGLMLLLVAPLLALNVVNVAFPLFSSVPFMAGLRALAPERAATLEARPGLSARVSVALALRRLMLNLAALLGCFALALLPVVGPPLAATLQALWTARSLGSELLDPYFERLGLGLEGQRRFVREHLGAVLGHGAVAAPLLAVPLLGALSFGLLQAATAHVVVRVLESDTEPEATAADAG